MMKIWLFAASLVLSISCSLAADRLPSISCDRSLDAPFAGAVALIETKPVEARTRFEQMLARHPDCAILYWGLARTTGDRNMQEEYWSSAVYWGAVAGASETEWRMISSLLPVGR